MIENDGEEETAGGDDQIEDGQPDAVLKIVSWAISSSKKKRRMAMAPSSTRCSALVRRNHARPRD